MTHKSDVGGVRLNVSNAQAVRSVYHELVESVKRLRPQARIDEATVERMYNPPHGRELYVGVMRDEVFGPVVSFGLGDVAIEVLRNRACALPPLNTFIVQDLVLSSNSAFSVSALFDEPAIFWVQRAL
ncbi:MAG: acetate--CoA ligase family protein [Sulfuricaulis sp.]